MASPVVDVSALFNLLSPLAIVVVVVGILAHVATPRGTRSSRSQSKGGRPTQPDVDRSLQGEAAVNKWINLNLDSSVYHLLADIMLPTPTRTTQIDHVIVSRYGIFVVETKTYSGWIYGDEKEAQWTQVLYKNKERFQNPLRQNFLHVKTMSDLMGIPIDRFKPVVVFAGEAEFKSDRPRGVLKPDELPEYIQSFATPLIKDVQVPEIVSVIKAWESTIEDQTTAAHVKRLLEDHKPVSADSAPPLCPHCGSTMVLRTRRRDHSRFWGCPKYPGCKGIRQVA